MRKKINNEIKLYIGTITSVLGNKIFDFANNLLLASINLKSSRLLAIYQSLEVVISVLLNLFGGAFSDIIKRKNRIVIITDIISGILMLFILFIPFNNIVVSIIIVNILLSILSSFNSPASKALIKFAVQENKVARFNSVLHISIQIIKVITPIITLFLMNIIGYRMIIIFNSITFFVSAIFEYSLELVSYKEGETIKFKDKKKPSIFICIKEGIIYMLNEKKIFILILTSSMINIFLSGYNLYLPYSINLFKKIYIFNTDFNPYTLFISLEAIGGIIGGALIYKFSQKKETKRTYLFSFLFMTGASILGFYISLIKNYNLLVSSIFILFFSLFLSMFNIEFFTCIHNEVKEEYIGRIFSIIFTIAVMFMPIGTFIFSYIFNTTSYLQYFIIGFGIITISIIGKYYFSFYNN